MGSVQSQDVETGRISHNANSVDPRSPCPEIVRTPLQVVVDKNDPRSPSTRIMRTPIDKCHEQISPKVNNENQGEKCPLLKHCVQVEKKSLLREFNN